MNTEIQHLLKQLPSIDELVRMFERSGKDSWPRWALVQAARAEVDHLRQQVIAGTIQAIEIDQQAVEKRIDELLAPSLRPVFNATGVVLHTNLGRAPLSKAAIARIQQIACGYCNLEYLLDERRRGSRHQHIAELISQICAAEDALVVNNNAAALLLTLTALAKGRNVIVSRGELIEIGGSFRLPEIMSTSGAILKEVGTTNRTHPRDYECAIDADTALLLKVHRSNFALIGFTKEVDPRDLVAIGRARRLPAIFDLGSGSIVDLRPLGLPQELSVQDALKIGFDLVTFSGDKLLGGPQAGIIVGSAELVSQLRSHPLMRPLRPDKMTLAALQVTFEAYRDGQALEQVPCLALLGIPAKRLKRQAARLRALLKKSMPGSYAFGLVETVSYVGGGALPHASLRSFAVSITHPQLGADAIECKLRAADIAIVARIEQDCVLLDVRTIAEQELSLLAATVCNALA